jgi:AraC-like DNA-binding protein
MDALSDILKTIKLSSAVYFRYDFSPPWGMNVEKGPFAQFHLLVRGRCCVYSSVDQKLITLSAGDIIVYPFGDSHWLADEPDSNRASGKQVIESIQGNKPIFRGDETGATLVCGHFEFDRDYNHPFINALPQRLIISSTDPHQLSWLETITSVIIQEAGSKYPGTDVVTTKLAEVLFIQILRTYMKQENISKGIFLAMNDSKINNALGLIHTQPGDPWTLESLAHRIGMSRSAFASRFKHLVGMTPMDYMTKLRMYKAKELLAIDQFSLLQIAEKVSYKSEAAFNRAFKRQFNQNPGKLRRSL